MAQYITSDVQEAIVDDETSRLEMAIVAATSPDDVRARAGEYDGVVVEDELPSGVVPVSVDTDVATDFLDTPAIGSASFATREVQL
ncbi:hypothetical protein [Haloarcula montana]|uniref:hypothetical protein n=1 Tax=Haloarcula montana TaxID=3111776 RepID=UPI002D78EF86|nr:hypothetical protein [Haloarcula sp. GH36]